MLVSSDVWRMHTGMDAPVVALLPAEGGVAASVLTLSWAKARAAEGGSFSLSCGSPSTLQLLAGCYSPGWILGFSGTRQEDCTS